MSTHLPKTIASFFTSIFTSFIRSGARTGIALLCCGFIATATLGVEAAGSVATPGTAPGYLRTAQYADYDGSATQAVTYRGYRSSRGYSKRRYSRRGYSRRNFSRNSHTKKRYSRKRYSPRGYSQRYYNGYSRSNRFGKRRS